MATLRLERELIRIDLSPWEQLAALHRPLAVRRRAVVQVEEFAKPFSALRGIRFGTWVPALIAYGTFRHREGKDFVAVRRGRPALRLVLEGGRYAAIVVSVDPDEAGDLAAAVARR